MVTGTDSIADIRKDTENLTFIEGNAIQTLFIETSLEQRMNKKNRDETKELTISAPLEQYSVSNSIS